ncbi:hypothetical protein LEP1GSC021_4078 [Leptospira noguchii str. 1993005606]|uniref:Uncharacterized protein n=1 Tax=Leptospira noguchii str. 2007001578 TaxID=1049974 RepID=A0ABN0J3W0_9LEPT|nr:hypothetical protein LEP1GSC035_4141 [Leptospira noguchii str. 2007001578]EPE83941.1 hypothetical protein LEP1GSC021_4078 [Leptospira noguchii str. 1993005606]
MLSSILILKSYSTCGVGYGPVRAAIGSRIRPDFFTQNLR